MWLVLFTMTFQRAITAANADERHRPAMWMWVAAPAIACLAYNSIVGETNSNGALTFDNVSKSFMFMALSLFFCLGMCVAVLCVSAKCHWGVRHCPPMAVDAVLSCADTCVSHGVCAEIIRCHSRTRLFQCSAQSEACQLHPTANSFLDEIQQWHSWQRPATTGSKVCIYYIIYYIIYYTI